VIRKTAGIQFVLFFAVLFMALTVSLVWLWTAKNSWSGVMLERQVNAGKTISGGILERVWADAANLENSFLPGRHVHIPGLAGQLIVLDTSLPRTFRNGVRAALRPALTEALAREPAATFAWSRLCWLDLLLAGPNRQSLAALRMSVYTAPAKRSLLFWRLDALARHRVLWDEEIENLTRRQVAYAWKVASRKTLAWALDAGLVEMLRDVLHSPEERQRLETLLEKTTHSS
jgi:hypothetical protein